MATATAVAGAITVLSTGPSHNGGQYLTVSCVDRDTYGEAFGALPAAVDYEGRRYTKTGWNSDTSYAVYQTGIPVAIAAGA